MTYNHRCFLVMMHDRDTGEVVYTTYDAPKRSSGSVVAGVVAITHGSSYGDALQTMERFAAANYPGLNVAYQ